MKAAEAQASYQYGWERGDARRSNTSPTNNVPPRSLNTFWYDVGDTDGASGRARRSFNANFTYAANSDERRAYDDGYALASEPRSVGFDAWFAAGKADREAGRSKDWAIKSIVAPPIGTTRPAPAYQPKPNAGPPVVVQAPQPNGGVNQPDVVMRPAQGPVPPWMWQPGMGAGSGVILYGPGYYLDLSKFQSFQPRR